MTTRTTIAITCVLCGTVHDAPRGAGDYGLCPDHYNRDTLREWDRIASARRHLSPGTPDSLKLSDWLAIVSAWRGLCAICEQVSFSQISMWRPGAGLTADNTIPTCRACGWHLAHGWDNALDRVHSQMRQGNA